MPGIMRLFVRVEGGSPFALILQDNLLPEHYVEIALKHFREQWQTTRQVPELVLIRRIVFRNSDQLLDFRKKSSRVRPPPVLADQSAMASLVRRAQPQSVYEATAYPDVIRQEMVVTNPPSNAIVAFCESELVIKDVTLNRLIVKMTDPLCSPFIEDVFWDTYRAYSSPTEVLEKIIERYETPVLTPVGAVQRSPLDEEHYSLVAHAVRMRCVQCLEHWVERYFFDFADDQVFHKLNRWVRERIDLDGIPARVLQLMHAGNRTALRHRRPPPAPGVFNRTLTPSGVLAKFHPREIANQLTLLTLFVHNQIYPCELLANLWVGPEAANVPNFGLYSDFINRVSNWVTYAIVSEKEQALRTNNLAVLLVLCDELLKTNNWDALVAVHGGISEPCVTRLTATIAGLSSESVTLMTKFEELMNVRGASRALKAAMASSPRPHFPSIVVHLNDLSSLEKIPVAHDGMINFVRCVHQHNLIRFLLDGKGTRLDVVADPDLQGVFSFWRAVDEGVLSGMSLEAQAR